MEMEKLVENQIKGAGDKNKIWLIDEYKQVSSVIKKQHLAFVKITTKKNWWWKGDEMGWIKKVKKAKKM